MTVARTRAVGAVLTAAACVAVLSTTSAFQSGVRTLMAEVGLVDNFGWIMGGTGNPVPDSQYLTNVEGLYLSNYPDSVYNYSAAGNSGAVLPDHLLSQPARPGFR